MNDQETKEYILRILREEFFAQGIELATIIFFGSRARGNARPESDWDFIVVCKNRLDRKQKTDIWLTINQKLAEHRIDADILIKNEMEFEQDKLDTGKVTYYALKEGGDHLKDQSETARLWLIKGDHDIKIGRDESTTVNPATDAICFHMQQCVEKYLKGFLVFHGKEIERTHNISRILQECMAQDVSFLKIDIPSVNRLTLYATELRYPDDFYMPSLDETHDAIQQAEMVRTFVWEKLQNAGFDIKENGEER